MKKLVLVGLVLLASVMVLVGCKHEHEHEHTFGDWKTKKSPTEQTSGSKERVCGVCSYSEIKEIEKVPSGFVYIPEGSFQMGSEEGYDDNKPVHEVKISKGFFMGSCEVTQEEYEKYCSYGEGTSNSVWGDGDDYPAYCVSWYDALVYCNKRSLAEGLTPCYTINKSTDPEDWGSVPISSISSWNEVICKWDANGYRLPTEAEWEYAARAGDDTTEALIWSGTDKEEELEKYAWYSSNSENKIHEVGMQAPNAYGLCDMSGNVSEWCWDWFGENYYSQAESVSDPKGASLGDYRVHRGGCWVEDSYLCAVSIRNFGEHGRYVNYGFRMVRTAPVAE